MLEEIEWTGFHDLTIRIQLFVSFLTLTLSMSSFTPPSPPSKKRIKNKTGQWAIWLLSIQQLSILLLIMGRIFCVYHIYEGDNTMAANCNLFALPSPCRAKFAREPYGQRLTCNLALFFVHTAGI